jgi:lipopolysaccharide export system protein LptA
MHCDEARWWEASQRLLMLGNVMIDDGEHVLYAQRVDYDGVLRQEHASDGVTLISGDRQLQSEFLHYDQQTRITVARDDVMISDFVEHATLFGERANYDRSGDYGMITGAPYLVKEDSLSGEQLTVEGARIEVWGEGQRVVITDSVRFTKGDMRAECSRAEYLSDDSLLILEQIPVVWYRDREITGDTITLRLEGITFRSSQIRGNACIVTLDTTARDELEGASIDIDAHYTDEDTIQTITVKGQAVSRYHIEEAEEEQRGINVVTGDRLVLVIVGDRLQSVEVLSSPGQSTGVYTPKGLGTREGSVPSESKDGSSGKKDRSAQENNKRLDAQ